MNTNQTDITKNEGESQPVTNNRGEGAVHTVRPQPGQLRSAAGPSQRSRNKKRRKKRRRRILFFLVFFLISVGIGWWYTHRSPSDQESADSTAIVARRDFSSSVLATGAVRAQVGAEVRVGARISGKVERLLANIGDDVTQGQVVAQLEKAELEAMVATREAELQLAIAKLSAVENLLPLEIQKAELDMSRWQATRTLSEQEISRELRLLDLNATSEQSVEQAQERLAVVESQLASAEKAYELAKASCKEDRIQASAEVDRARSVLDNTKVQLSYATITAPIDGVIASVSTEEGETVAAGMQAPTFVTIIDLNRLQVDAYVDEVDIGKVEVGQRAVFTVDAFPATEFEGEVSAIYPKAVIQDNVVNYDVVIDIETPFHGLLRPEMTASVTILLEVKTDVLAIPAEAVKREQGKSVVYVLNDGRTKVCEITIGRRDSQWVEVLAGLEEGQTVFLEPSTTSEPKS